jgi:hypothetical protein
MFRQLACAGKFADTFAFQAACADKFSFQFTQVFEYKGNLHKKSNRNHRADKFTITFQTNLLSTTAGKSFVSACAYLTR